MELALEVLLWPFVACLVLTGIHTYLGLHVVSRGVIFVDLALAQIAAMGATFAFLLGYPPDSNSAYFYSLLFAWTGAAIFSISRLKEQHIPQEAIIGITFAVASATTILIADRSPQGAELVEAMLTGALLWTPRAKIIETALIYAAVGGFHWYFRDRFLTISLDHQRAEAEGWNIRWWDFLFYASFGFVITSSVAIAGVLLVFSFLVIPSVIAMMFSRTIGGRLAIGWTAGTVVSMVGLSLSYGYDFPSGPAVVCAFGLALVAAATLRYIVVAERTWVALARTAAASLVIAGALWMAFFTADRDAERAQRSAAASAAAARAAGGADVPPGERIAQAFAALEASPEAPPEAAMETLLGVGESLHLMMSTGEITVSESAVLAIANAPDDVRLEDLLNEIAFHARDAWAKLRGAQALLERRNPLGVEAMLELLSSSQPILLQMEAIESLRAATGQSFGYDPEADAAANGEALERWKSWWEANASQPFIGRDDDER
jgi:zinc/manganese transport system permease protein